MCDCPRSPRIGITRALALALALTLASVSRPTVVAQEPTLFTDQTAAQGVQHLHRAIQGDRLKMGAGGAWGDYDGDGDLDLYVADQVGSNKLFKNLGGGTGFVDVAAELGIQDAGGQGTGALWGDYDNDGDKDLYVMNRGANVMFRNDGPGQSVSWVFTDVTAAVGVGGFGRTAAAVYGDYDNDGWLDLYVATHSHPTTLPVAGDAYREDRLYHNVAGPNGQRVFVDVAPDVFGSQILANTLAHSVGFFDFDNDGDLDIYLVNERLGGDVGLLGNIMWRNDGPNGLGGWKFTDVTALTNTTLRNNPMGLAIGDYNNDGWLDFAMTDIAPNYLYQNNGGVFTEVGAQAGIRRAKIPGTSTNQIGWGLVFLDYNLDGLEDLYVATGELSGTPDQPNPLFRNNGDSPNNTFTDVTSVSGANDPSKSRTVVKGDYDGDGDEDLYVVNYGQAAHLYRNDRIGGDYLVLELVGTLSNRDAIGARVKVSAAGLPNQYRMVQSGSTTGGSNELALFFGVTGHATVDAVTIDWPSGHQTVLNDIATNQRLQIVEPVVSSMLSIGDVEVGEGGAGSTNAVFTVRVAPASSSDITVDYSTIDGTATAGTDYVQTLGTLTIPAGATMVSITVPIINDAIDEDTTETFVVQLSNASGGTLADAEAAGVIRDDDGFLFEDEFDDGVMTCTASGGTWTESNGALVGTVAKGIGRATAPLPWPSGGSACALCTIEASLQTGGGLGNKVGLVGWRQASDWNNYVELTLEEEANRWVLTQFVNAVATVKKTFTQTLDPNVAYPVKMSYDGFNLKAYVNGVLIITLQPSGAITGNVGFRVTKATGVFTFIRVF